MDTAPRRPLRIVHVVDSLEPGGMENGITNVARRLPPDQFSLHVCCLRARGAFAERMPQPEQVVALDKAPGFSMRYARALARQFAQIAPDLVHSHNLGPLIYSAGATRLGRRWPIVHGEHAELSPPELQRKRLALRKLLYRCCRRVHTVSTSLTEQLIAHGMPAAKLETVINGVDCEVFKAGPADHALVPDHIGRLQLIGNVGRFGQFKRQVELVDAFDLLADGRRDVGLLLVGDGGPNKSAVAERVAASPHSDRIHLAGFQSDPAPYYRLMRLLVVPSENEGMSNAILEALASGLPVLSNNSCGGDEVIGGTGAGSVVAMPDPPAIAAAIRDMLADATALENMRLAARDLAERRFSIAAMTDRYAEIYRRYAKRAARA